MYQELVDLVKELTDKVKKARMEKIQVEQDVRTEMSHEMNSLMNEMQETHRLVK